MPCEFFLGELVPSPCQASARTIYATVGTYRNAREQVFANRAVTMASVIRRSPNAFHFLRQCSILSKAGQGDLTSQFEVAQMCVVSFLILSLTPYEIDSY